MILCVCCGKEIKAEQRFTLIQGPAHSICVGYPTAVSQAGEETEQRVAASTAQKEQGNGE